jgi:hypothetical protein
MPARRPGGAIGTSRRLPACWRERREGSHQMDEVVNRFARELADSIAAAVAESAQVEACRERARAAGYEMKVNLEAVVGFVNRTPPPVEEGDAQPAAAATKALVPRKAFDITVNDRRFLRSLRIAAEEMKVEETN